MVEVVPMHAGHIDSVVDLHITSLPDDFLPRLGPGFLRALYGGLLNLPCTVALVAWEQLHLAGFVVGTVSSRAMYRQLLRRNGATLAVHVLRGTSGRPSVVTHALRLLAQLRRAPVGLPEAEMCVLAVAPFDRRQGVGRALVLALDEAFSARGVAGYKVSTTTDNPAATTFYGRLGFHHRANFLLGRRHFQIYTRNLVSPGDSN